MALAAIGEHAKTEEARARRLTFVSLAGTSGFLLGPMMGVFVARSAAVLFPAISNVGPLVLPLAVTAALALLAAVGAILTVPGKVGGAASPERSRQPVLQSEKSLVPRLLALAFIVSAGVGVFGVGLALRGKQELGLTQYQIATMYTECSSVMLIVQAIVFSPSVRPETTRWFIVPAFAILAGGLFLVPRTSDFKLVLIVIGAVAASAGILSPILTYRVSSKAGKAQGAQLRQQTAAASLGAAAGSAAGGLLFEVAWLPNASFVLITGLTVIGLLISLALPRMLMRPRHDDPDVGRQMNPASARIHHPRSPCQKSIH